MFGWEKAVGEAAELGGGTGSRQRLAVAVNESGGPYEGMAEAWA